jgi:putative spermidine/putrescine transport system permease protein
MIKEKKETFWLIFPITLVLAVCFILPMIYVLNSSFKEGGIKNYLMFLTDSFYLGILWNTIKISIITTLICLVLGYPVAYFIGRMESKLKNTMMIIILFPFLVSSVVRSYGWMVILGNKGLLNQLLLAIGIIDEPLKILYTSKAVIIGLVHLLMPYMIFSLAGIIQGIDQNLEFAAASLGYGKIKTFLKITLPLSAPGILAGCILVFNLSMTSYVTPKLLGGSSFFMMSIMVFQEVNTNFNWPLAASISYILLFFILAFLVIFNILGSKINKRLGGTKNV